MWHPQTPVFIAVWYVWKELVLLEGICSIILQPVYTNSKELKALVWQLSRKCAIS